MNESEAKKIVLNRTVVTPQRVVVAKAIVLSACQNTSSSKDLIDAVLDANGVAMPQQVTFQESVDQMPELMILAEALSWSLSAREAIWSLIYGGYLFPLADSHDSTPSVGWTTGRTSSRWIFNEFTLPVPDQVRRAPSLRGSNDQFLAEPDLYLNTLGIPNMHTEIASAFQEAVKCFRQELYTATLAMLGKASEGAWLELGASLLGYVPDNEQSIFSKQRVVLEDPMMGTFRKIEAVFALFDRQDIFNRLAIVSGIKPRELRAVAVWSDSVRDSRNTIHFGVSPATPNTYEKVAALLIGTAPNVRILYRLKMAADAGPK